MAKISIVIILFLVVKGESNFAQKNDAQAALFNVGLSSVVSGFGALVNKKPGEKGGKIFLRGMWQGAIGGIIVFGSKKMVYQYAQSENYAWLWSSKLLNAAGVSICENAGANQKFLSRWHVNFGFNRIELNTDKSFKLNYRLMPFAFAGFIYASTKGSFDLEQTLKVGQPFFWTHVSSWPEGGFSISNSIVLNKAIFNNSQSIAHEVIHTYQIQGDVVFNNYHTKPVNHILNKNNGLTKFYKKWIYTDLSFLLSSGFYYLGSLNNRCYFDNIYEQEANYYSSRLSCSDL